MSALIDSRASLSFAEKISRLGGRFRDPEWRKFGRNLLLGKLLGLAVLAGTIVALNLTGSLFKIKEALADTPAAAAVMAVMPADLIDQAKNPVINPINTLWVLLGAFLVFGMQAGFTMLEAGMCRNRETVNVLVEYVIARSP